MGPFVRCKLFYKGVALRDTGTVLSCPVQAVHALLHRPRALLVFLVPLQELPVGFPGLLEGLLVEVCVREVKEQYRGEAGVLHLPMDFLQHRFGFLEQFLPGVGPAEP